MGRREVFSLHGAARRIVLGVEVQDKGMATKIRETPFARCGDYWHINKRLAECLGG